MRAPGVRGQTGMRDLTFRADGTIASATLPQMVLSEGISRSYFFFQNTSSAGTMYLEFGSARATATLTNGVVTSVAVTNAGFNFTRAPKLEFMGGGQAATGPAGGINSSFISAGQPGYPTATGRARAHCVMVADASGTGTLKVGSIVIDTGGSGYTKTPYVRIYNDPLDLNGCADPSVGSGSGLLLFPGQSVYDAHMATPTDQVAVFCSTLASSFFCKYLD